MANALAGLRQIELAQPDHPRKITYNVLLFCSPAESDDVPARVELVREIARDGDRVFVIKQGTGPGAFTTQAIDDRIIEVQVPSSTEDGAGKSDVVGEHSINDAWSTLRRDYHVEDAVGLVESSTWDPTARELDERYGWKRLSLPAPGSTGEQATAGLGGASWENLRPTIPALYPKVSVVVVTHNRLDVNRLCLSSIRQRTTYPNVEVVIVDNGSTDGTREYLSQLQAADPLFRVVLNDSNDGYAPANNRGVSIASGEVIVLLNNDTIVTRSWLSRIVLHLRDPRVALVGVMSSWRGNESGIEVSYQTLGELDDFAETNASTHDGESYDTTRPVFFCTAMRRAIFDEIGPLDERFAAGVGFEDDDYSVRVRRSGYRIVYARDVFVHHWGVATNNQRDVKEHLDLFERNRRLFEEKWGQRWSPTSSAD